MQGNSKKVANCESPKCDYCEFGKCHCQSSKVNTIRKNPMKEKELKNDNFLPGQMVSAYHYILQDPGRIYHKKGNQILLICYQEDTCLLTIPVVL